MPSLLDAPPQLPSTIRGWGALYHVEETASKPRHSLVVPAAKIKPAPYGGGGRKKKNLETCTEALGCETGGVDGCGAEAEGDAERTRRAARDEAEAAIATTEGPGACRSSAASRPLPPPLTTLAPGASSVRMVHERHAGRLEVYAVRAPGILDAERGEGRLRLRLLCGAGSDAAADAQSRRRQEPEAAKEAAKEAVGDEEEEGYGFAKYVRGGRCLDPEVGAAVAARLCNKWEREPARAAALWVATS